MGCSAIFACGWKLPTLRVLLTGGHGHLAQEFVRLFGSLHDVTATVRTTRPGHNAGARYVVAPDASALAEVLENNVFDAIVHLAQSRRPVLGALDDFKRFRDDLYLFSTVMEVAVTRGIKQIFIASTGGLYADSPSPLKETDRLLEPPDLDPYYASKLAIEAMVSPHFASHNITIGRFFFVYGPGQDRSKLLPRLIDSVRLGREVTVSPSGGVKLNPIYVKDAARAIQYGLTLEGSRIVNIAGPQATSIRDLADRLGRLTGTTPTYQPDGQDRNLVADTSTLSSIMGPDMIGLEEGLRRTVASALR